MLDRSRPIECNTPLEVELLAMLNEARREISRLKRPPEPPPPPRTQGKPARTRGAKFVTPPPPARRTIDEPAEPVREEPRARQTRLDRLPAGQAKIIDIQQAVCIKFGFTIIELRSQRRTQAVSEARHVAVMLCHALTLHSYPFIGRFFGGRDHTTMLHSVEKLEWVRHRLCSELTTQDSVNTWVRYAHNALREGRAKDHLEPPAAAELVVDIKALREA